jgi:hypothetical protein
MPHPGRAGLAWYMMRSADSPAWGGPARDDVPLSRPAVDPAVPRAARGILCAKGTPLTPACQPRPRRERGLVPAGRGRRFVTADDAVTGLTAAMIVAVTGAAPWAFGVLIYQDPAGWQSAAGSYALLLSELIMVVSMLVFTTRAARGERFTPAAVAREYHGRYLTGADLDAPGRVLLRRAQDAADAIRSAAVSKAGLLDGAATDAALTAQEWDIAQALREQAGLRARRAAVGEPPPGSAAARLLAQHNDAARAAEESITRRVMALERYAAEVRAADEAYRQRLQHAAIAGLSAPHLDMLARTAADDHGIAELDAMTRQAAGLRRCLE